MYLLETDVVCELRNSRTGKADKNVVAWAASVPVASLFLSAITILELETGVLLIAQRDKAQGEILRLWLESHVLPAFASRILSVDTIVAQRCASLHVPVNRSESNALIAATALVHGMTVVTQNTVDFYATGARVLNPWQASSPTPSP